MTFEDIEKMNYQQFNTKAGVDKKDKLKPRDILDFDDFNDSDDEILQKFRVESPNKRNGKKGS